MEEPPPRTPKKTARARLWEVARGALLIGSVLLASHCYTTRDVLRGSAPRVQALSLQGSTVQIPAADRRPRMVRFFATWCGVCRAEEHNLRAMASSGQVIMIASDSGSADAIRRYAREHELLMPIVVDDGTLKRKFGVSAYPTSVFVDGEGEIDFVVVGYTTELGMRLRLFATR